MSPICYTHCFINGCNSLCNYVFYFNKNIQLRGTLKGKKLSIMQRWTEKFHIQCFYTIIYLPGKYIYCKVTGYKVFDLILSQTGITLHSLEGQWIACFPINKPCRVGLLVSVSASHTVGYGFVPWPGHTKDHHKYGTNCLPALHKCFRVGD